MPAINGYTIKHVSGTTITVGPGNAQSASGGSIDNPHDLTIDIATDTDGGHHSDAMLAVYVLKDGNSVTGKCSHDFGWTPASGQHRRVGAVRVTANGKLAEAFQSSSGQVRPTKYTDPGNDTKFKVPKTTGGIIEFSRYIVPGSEVEIAFSASIPNAEISVKGADGVTQMVIGGGVLNIRTNPSGNGDFTSKDSDVDVTVLSFQDVV